MGTTGKMCKATTKSGAPCQSYAIEGSEFCYWHDPAKAADRKEARARGGRARHGRKLRPISEQEPLEIHDLGDVVRLVTEEINAVRSLEVSISRGRTIGYLAGVLVDIYRESELERRIVALEARAG